ncbi:UDP-glucuronosyltransferase [Aphelenchoides bicaudatus]|nr:UDP-glucuronosyltransferase [Aphelenchoides bicaudatus]
MMLFQVLFGFVFCFVHLSALKILVYNPRFGLSHVKFTGHLGDILVEQGHEVINYQPVNTEKFNQTGVRLAKILIREADYPLMLDQRFFAQQLWTAQLGGIINSYVVRMTQRLGNAFATYCKCEFCHQLEDDELMEQLKKEQFDVGITEYFDYCALGLFTRIGLEKFVAVYISPLTQSRSYVPEITTPSIPPLNFVERFKNHFGYLISSNFIFPRMLQIYNDKFRPILGQDFDINKKFADAQLVFLNSDEFLEFSRPTSHKFVNIGGIGMSKPGKLDEKYQRIMDQASKIVYVSFGTVAKSCDMPVETKRSFLDAFAQHPEILFLWKYECDDDIAANHSNVILDTWWPQPNILENPKVLTFITHGGSGSISESIHSGVPPIVIPLFADQIRNSKMIEYRHAGISISKFDLNKQSISNAISLMISDERYKQNAQKLSRLIKGKPMNARDRFVQYIEFVGNNDNVGEILDIEGRYLSSIQFYNLDIMFLTLLFLFISVLIAYKSVNFVVQLLFRKFRKIKND